MKISQFEPSKYFHLVVAGAPLKKFSYNLVGIAFGPNGRSYDEDFLEGSLGRFKPALFHNSMRMQKRAKNGDEDSEENGEDEMASDSTDDLLLLRDQQEAAIEWLEVRQRGHAPVRIDLGPMDKPMAAMHQCTDELLTHWGIDVKAHRNLASSPVPTRSPSDWISWRDYPSDLLASGAQGIIQFRLSIDADGKPTQCHIQQSTRPEGFDKAVCNAMMKRARFEPARTKDGKAIASYWRTSVRFEMPR